MPAAYQSVLHHPGALRFALPGFVARVPMAMNALAVLLVVHARTGSYGLAGAASALGTVSQAAATPFVGRLVDRRGQSAVLRPLLIAHLAGLGLLIVSDLANWPTPALFAGAAIAGTAQPPYPALVRARWTWLLGRAPALAAALALESAGDEVVYVIGPVLVSTLVTVRPVLALIASAALVSVGTVGFVTARGSEPVPTPANKLMEPAWRLLGLRVVVLSVIALGTVFGSLDVTVVAFAQVHNASAAAGPLLALIAFGSMIGGLWYGARRWRVDEAARYPLSLAVLTGGALLPLAADHVLTMAPIDLILGLAIAPSLIASSSLVVSTVRATRLTEGFAWQSAGINIGAAAGFALAGRLVDAGGVRVGLLLPPSAAAVAAAVAAVGWWIGRNPGSGRRLRVPR